MSLTDILRLKRAQHKLKKQQKLQKKVEDMILHFINDKQSYSVSKAIFSTENLNNKKLLENLIEKAHAIYNPWYQLYVVSSDLQDDEENDDNDTDISNDEILQEIVRKLSTSQKFARELKNRPFTSFKLLQDITQNYYPAIKKIIINLCKEKPEIAKTLLTNQCFLSHLSQYIPEAFSEGDDKETNLIEELKEIGIIQPRQALHIDKKKEEFINKAHILLKKHPHSDQMEAINHLLTLYNKKFKNLKTIKYSNPYEYFYQKSISDKQKAKEAEAEEKEKAEKKELDSLYTQLLNRKQNLEFFGDQYIYLVNQELTTNIINEIKNEKILKKLQDKLASERDDFLTECNNERSYYFDQKDIFHTISQLLDSIHTKDTNENMMKIDIIMMEIMSYKDIIIQKRTKIPEGKEQKRILQNLLNAMYKHKMITTIKAQRYIINQLLN